MRCTVKAIFEIRNVDTKPWKGMPQSVEDDFLLKEIVANLKYHLVDPAVFDNVDIMIIESNEQEETTIDDKS